MLSSQIDKQELRKFYFSIFSVVVLLAIILPLVFKSPAKREWLPQETEAILSGKHPAIAARRIAQTLGKRTERGVETIWSGLTTDAQRTPVLNLERDAVRVTRGLTTANRAKRSANLSSSRQKTTLNRPRLGREGPEF